MDRLPTCIYVLDAQGTFLYANAALCRLVGWTAGELVGHPFSRIVHPEDVQALGRQINERRRGERAATDLEVRLLCGARADLSAPQLIRYVRLHAEGLHSAGQFIGTCGVVRDITEERRRWRDLADSAEVYRQLMDTAPATIAVEQKGRIAYVNATGAALLGAADPQALKGMDLLSVVAPCCRAAIAELRAHPASQDQAGWSEAQLLRADGRLIDVDFIYRDIEYRGEPAAEVMVVDSTERRRAERERQALQRLSHTLTRSATARELGAALAAEARSLSGLDAFLLVVREQHSGLWRSAYCLDTAERADQPTEFPPEASSDTPWSPIDAASLVNVENGRAVDAGFVPFGFVARRSRSMMFAPIRWNGEAVGVVTVQSYDERSYTQADLDLLQSMANHCGGCLARLQAEEEREAALGELLLRRAMGVRSDRLRALREMGAGIAHELNQPLQGVRGLAEHVMVAMDRGWIAADQCVRDKLATIVAQADRIERTIAHAREFAREADRATRHPVQPNQVARAVAEAQGPDLESRGIRLELHLAADLPLIEANPYALEEAVRHLLNNGRHATEARYGRGPAAPPRALALRTSSALVAGRPWVSIEVADQGTGIPPEIRSRIWEPFFTSRGDRGRLGVGLSLVKAIVTEDGGQIDLESEVGAGTVVRLRFPARGDEITGRPAHAEQRPW